MNSLNWPAWYYGPQGQSQIFNSPIEVPEGWHDTPAKFGEDGEALEDAVTEIPGLEEALVAGSIASVDDDDGDKKPDVPEYNDITVAEIKTLLDDYEVEYEDADKKPELYAKLKAALEASE